MASNFTQNYAKCLVATSPDDQMVDGERPREFGRLTPEEISRMEHEVAMLGREFKIIEETHGKNVLNLVVVMGYIKQLLANARVARYLSQKYPEIMVQFQKLAETRNLADCTPMSRSGRPTASHLARSRDERDARHEGRENDQPVYLRHAPPS